MRQLKKKLRLALRRVVSKWSILDRDAQIIRSYFETTGSKMLQIGCGKRILPGWLNADFRPKTRNVLHLDATRPLPFEDDAFDNVFTEHMIEHIDFPNGQQLIDECLRVLKPGGRLRISTPDLAFLIDLYRAQERPGVARSGLQSEFLDHFLRTEIKDRRHNAPEDFDTFLINRFVRAWGHEFIYDEKTLRYAMMNSGFEGIVRNRLMESDHEELRSLEHADRKPDGHLDLESLILEGTKPVPSADVR